jgi:hypothetical protein
MQFADEISNVSVLPSRPQRTSGTTSARSEQARKAVARGELTTHIIDVLIINIHVLNNRRTRKCIAAALDDRFGRKPFQIALANKAVTARVNSPCETNYTDTHTLALRD